MKPLDVEMKALIGKIGVYKRKNLNTDSHREEIHLEYETILLFPLAEISGSCWDELREKYNDYFYGEK